ncbi:sugar-binding transcriptional regulator [Oceanobacillus sp. Castelsardo]|uniref:sugar-binding transcriptional regulator n=1 Tax=Oceanobacillus sp. Castelsardo TaxID=1851204 RepID=UPI00083939DB|nr:sugar-binding transcriptional regulator [Oceanobacillus sp. Castelsardo]
MNWEEERLLYRIAKLYYEEGYTQAKISKELGIYRTTIGRMLKRAQDKGIVKIQIQSSSDALFDLEDKIAKHFGMKEVVVVPSYTEQSNQDTNKSIGEACGSLLDRVILDDDIIGVTWGKTLGSMIHQLDELKPKNVECVPLVGGPGGMKSDYHVNAIALRLSSALNGSSHFINAAAVYNSIETAKEILQSTFMTDILDYWDDLTVALVGIGAQISSSNMVWSGFLGDYDQLELMEHDAIGEICSRFYTKKGEVIQSSISERTIAIPLEKLKDLRYSIGVAYSKEKVEAIIGAMNGKLINTLITNEETALEICESI